MTLKNQAFKQKNCDVHKKIPYTSSLVKKTGYSSNITEIEAIIASISGLATNSALIGVENEIPNASTLFKKQTIIQTLAKLKVKLIIITMANILLFQNLMI